jgi:hypothetical protein
VIDSGSESEILGDREYFILMADILCYRFERIINPKILGGRHKKSCLPHCDALPGLTRIINFDQDTHVIHD